ncbi:MAG: ribbon-helix-helix domain-containing protein [Ferrovum sp.]|jgi:negative regulator of replication initiation|nr:ribbon-helix-helix domain-containing protein [Ferrovum sp.]NDU88685.1 ribbon-helix-helix domain-containing protein [Ferrovum sp.]
MHRTQIYLQNDMYEKLKAQSRNVGVSISELIRRSLEKDLQQDTVADARAFFKRLKPLESFARAEPENYVRDLRNTSRLLQAQIDDA